MAMGEDTRDGAGQERVAQALYLWWQRDEGDEDVEPWESIGRQGQTLFREGAALVLAALADETPTGCPSCGAAHPASRFKHPTRCPDTWHDSWPGRSAGT